MDEIKQKLPSFHFVHENEGYGLLTNLRLFVLVLNKLDFISLPYTNKVHEFPDLLVLTAHLDVLSDQWVD